MMNRRAWVKVIAQNWRTILGFTKEGVFGRGPARREVLNVPISLERPLVQESAAQPHDLIS